jgi:hypothetical protein
MFQLFHADHTEIASEKRLAVGPDGSFSADRIGTPCPTDAVYMHETGKIKSQAQ